MSEIATVTLELEYDYWADKDGDPVICGEFVDHVFPNLISPATFRATTKPHLGAVKVEILIDHNHETNGSVGWTHLVRVGEEEFHDIHFVAEEALDFPAEGGVADDITLWLSAVPA